MESRISWAQWVLGLKLATVLLAVCTSATYYDSQAKLMCYQCAYSPPHVVFEEKDVPIYEKNKYGQLVKTFTKVQVSKQGSGGWSKCLGPFDEHFAEQSGIDLWECEGNCYTRADANGNIFRGCYNGEFGVDPDILSCREQAGAVYCFCNSDRCNREKAPDALSPVYGLNLLK